MVIATDEHGACRQPNSPYFVIIYIEIFRDLGNGKMFLQGLQIFNINAML